MGADKNVHIILGWPFLSTCDLLVEVRLGRLILGLGDGIVVFNLSDTLKKHFSFALCSFIEFVDIIDVLMEGVFPSVGMPDPLESSH